MDKWPEQLVIGGVAYKVEYIPHRDEIDDGDDCNLCGQVNWRKHHIQIWAGHGNKIQEPIEQFDTLLHELLHVVFSQNPAMGRLLVDDTEEILITCLSRALSDTLTRNKIVLLPESPDLGALHDAAFDKGG